MIFTPPQPPIKPPIVTVWIHGTKLDECLPFVFGGLAKRIAPILFEHKQGMNILSALDVQSYDFIRSAALGTSGPTLFQSENMYTFGWSGKLTLEARRNAAQDLFNELKSLVKKYVKTCGCYPEIILVSHSHGGNVILHLAEIIDTDGFELIVSKAILLACPVQKHTAHLISSPVFKRIYSLHSHTDIIQIADPQGIHDKNNLTKPLLSIRHFDSHPKLAQASIRWKKYPIVHSADHLFHALTMKKLMKGLKAVSYFKKNRGLLHIEFQLLPFVRQLPFIIDNLDKFFESNSNCPSHKDHDIVIEL